MLDKADAQPFYFGGDSESYFWRAAKIEDEIFVQRVQHSDTSTEESYRYCSVYDRNSQLDIYDDIVIDFVMYFAKSWRKGSGSVEGAFRDVAGEDDTGLADILGVFRKDYAAFLNDVMFWFAVVLDTEPNEDGVTVICEKSCLSERSRVVKHVLDRLALDNPTVISVGNTMFVWRLISAHDDIWFSKITSRSYDDYIFYTEEYGCVEPEDDDAYNALRDSIRGSLMIDGWELIDDDESDFEGMLNLVGLSLEAI